MTTLLARSCVLALVLGSAVLSNGQRAIQPTSSMEITPLPSINTSSFIPQVLRTSRNATPQAQSAPPFANQKGGLGAVERILSGDPLDKDLLKWPSLRQNSYSRPDPTLGVGTNQVVVTANSAVAIHNRLGTLLFERELKDFFDSTAPLGYPRSGYDPIAQRFYVLAMDLRWNEGINRVMLAVSDDGDPRGSWHRYSIDTQVVDGADTYIMFSPSLGFNKDAVVVAGNLFSNGAYGGTSFVYLPKPPLLSGLPVTAKLFRDPNAINYRMSEISDSGIKSLHGVSVHDSTHVKVSTFSNTHTSTPVMNSWLVTVPEFDAPSARIPGISGEIWLYDGPGTASYRSGKLLTAHTMSPDGQIQTGIRWYELDVAGAPTTAPTLVQSGDVVAPSVNDYYFTPSIEKNASGEISVMFTRTNATIAPETWVAARAKADALGTMRAPFRIATSDAGLVGHWTDLIKVVVDPVDGRSFWGVSMLGAADPSYQAWKTDVAKWLLAPTLASVQLPTSISSGETATGTVVLSNPTYKDTVVTLSSGAAFLTVPDKVRVLAGSESATFTLQAGTPASTTDVTVTATLGANSVSANTRVFGARPEFNLSRTSVEGGSGQLTTLTVRLSKPAPAGGTVVTLGSNSSHVTLPPTLTVPAGQSSASLDFAATAASSNVTVTLSGTWAGTTRTRVLTVTPPEVAEFLLTTRVVGGSTNKVMALVTLANNAGPGGQQVSLTSTSALVAVPATMTIPAGTKTKEIELVHSSAATTTTVTITAVTGVKPISRNIIVSPPVAAKLSPAPGVIVGGAGHSILYTVGIGSVAPAGGVKVDLVVSDPSVVLSAPFVIVPAGSKTTTVTVTAPNAVNAQLEVKFTASANGGGQSTVVFVRPVWVDTMSIAPAEVVGGSATTATLTLNLNAAAPAGGVTVDLSSSDPSAASVPATVTIPEGQTGATVAVSHFKVSSNRKVTITGTLNGTSKTAKIVIQR